MSDSAIKSSVFIVDDDESIRDSFAALLGSRQILTACFASAREFLDFVDVRTRGCLVLDFRLPDMNGLEVQAHLIAAGIPLPIIFMTAYADVPIAVEAMKRGAVDFVEKPVQEEVIVERVDRALRIDRESASRQAEATEVEARIASLTPRELEVFNCIVAGQQNKEIARELNISPRTVEVHRARVLEKMQAQCLSHLIRMALVAGRGQDSGH